MGGRAPGPVTPASRPPSVRGHGADHAGAPTASLRLDRELLEFEEKAVVLRSHSEAATLLLLQQAENVSVPPAPLFYLCGVLLVELCPGVVMQARTSLSSALAFGQTARGGAGMGRRRGRGC